MGDVIPFAVQFTSAHLCKQRANQPQSAEDRTGSETATDSSGRRSSPHKILGDKMTSCLPHSASGSFVTKALKAPFTCTFGKCCVQGGCNLLQVPYFIPKVQQLFKSPPSRIQPALQHSLEQLASTLQKDTRLYWVFILMVTKQDLEIPEKNCAWIYKFLPIYLHSQKQQPVGTASGEPA